MRLGYDALQKRGLIGIALFWLRIFLLAIAFAAGLYAIYWMSLGASAIWLAAVDSSILTSNFFLMLTSFGSIAFLVLEWCGFRVFYDGLVGHLFVVSTLASHLICCVLMGLATDAEAEACLGDVLDYCARHFAATEVIDFFQRYPTDNSQHAYVTARTSNSYNLMVAFVWAWFPATILFLFGSCALDEERSPSTDLAPLQASEGTDDGSGENLE
jgi:hypothetical protein